MLQTITFSVTSSVTIALEEIQQRLDAAFRDEDNLSASVTVHRVVMDATEAETFKYTVTFSVDTPREFKWSDMEVTLTGLFGASGSDVIVTRIVGSRFQDKREFELVRSYRADIVDPD